MKASKKKVARVRRRGFEKKHSFRSISDRSIVGRPKTLGAAYRRLLLSPCPLDADMRTWAEVVGEAILTRALGGDVTAAAEIRKATEGEMSRHTLDWEDIAKQFGLDPQIIFTNIEKQLRDLMA